MAHLTQKQVEDYRDSRLPVAELLPVSDHLGACETCRRHIQAANDADARFLTIRSEVFDGEPEDALATTHLTEAQMADYVDGQRSRDTLQTLEDHLGTCEYCALTVADLRAFRNEVAPTLDREYYPEAVPVAAPQESRWRRTVASLALLRAFPTPVFGTALALLFLVAIGWLVLRRQAERNPQTEIAAVPTPALQPSAPVEPEPTPAQMEPASAVAQLKDGAGVLSLDQQGKLSGAEDQPPAYQNLIRKAFTNGRLERSAQLEGLTRPGSLLMSEDNVASGFGVIEPAGTVLLSNQPTLRWSTLAGASAYTVEVYDADFNLVVASPPLTRQAWSLPQALPRGRVYSWQVKAMKDGQEITSPRPPAPQAKFRVLDQARANELTKARRAYPSAHLTLALLYADAGLLKDAEQELRAVQKANPDSELARKLLRQVQSLRRRGQ